MHLLFYLLVFLLVLIVSSTILSFTHALIQILLGIELLLCLPNNQYHLDTELSLWFLVIGPLLFREAHSL